MTRFTFDPTVSRLPADGRCAITVPRLASFDRVLVTVPDLQCAALIARFAVTSVLPLTFGTTQPSVFFVCLGCACTGGVDVAPAKTAVTVFEPSIVTVQVPAPEHAPLQLLNVAPDEGEAVSVTTAPASSAALHVAPQAIPPALLVTVPVPPPDFVTESVNRAGAAETVSTSCGAAS
jgi:hypothetical protein